MVHVDHFKELKKKDCSLQTDVYATDRVDETNVDIAKVTLRSPQEIDIISGNVEVETGMEFEIYVNAMHSDGKDFQQCDSLGNLLKWTVDDPNVAELHTLESPECAKLRNPHGRYCAVAKFVALKAGHTRVRVCLGYGGEKLCSETEIQAFEPLEIECAGRNKNENNDGTTLLVTKSSSAQVRLKKNTGPARWAGHEKSSSGVWVEEMECVDFEEDLGVFLSKDVAFPESDKTSDPDVVDMAFLPIHTTSEESSMYNSGKKRCKGAVAITQDQRNRVHTVRCDKEGFASLVVSVGSRTLSGPDDPYRRALTKKVITFICQAPTELRLLSLAGNTILSDTREIPLDVMVLWQGNHTTQPFDAEMRFDSHAGFEWNPSDRVSTRKMVKSEIAEAKVVHKESDFYCPAQRNRFVYTPSWHPIPEGDLSVEALVEGFQEELVLSVVSTVRLEPENVLLFAHCGNEGLLECRGGTGQYNLEMSDHSIWKRGAVATNKAPSARNASSVADVVTDNGLMSILPTKEGEFSVACQPYFTVEAGETRQETPREPVSSHVRIAGLHSVYASMPDYAERGQSVSMGLDLRSMLSDGGMGPSFARNQFQYMCVSVKMNDTDIISVESVDSSDETGDAGHDAADDYPAYFSITAKKTGCVQMKVYAVKSGLDAACPARERTRVDRSATTGNCNMPSEDAAALDSGFTADKYSFMSPAQKNSNSTVNAAMCSLDHRKYQTCEESTLLTMCVFDPLEIVTKKIGLMSETTCGPSSCGTTAALELKGGPFDHISFGCDEKKKPINYSVSVENGTVAWVDPCDGVIHGLGEGQTTVTVKAIAADGSDLSEAATADVVVSMNWWNYGDPHALVPDGAFPLTAETPNRIQRDGGETQCGSTISPLLRYHVSPAPDSRPIQVDSHGCISLCKPDSPGMPQHATMQVQSNAANLALLNITADKGLKIENGPADGLGYRTFQIVYPPQKKRPSKDTDDGLGQVRLAHPNGQVEEICVDLKGDAPACDVEVDPKGDAPPADEMKSSNSKTQKKSRSAAGAAGKQEKARVEQAQVDEIHMMALDDSIMVFNGVSDRQRRFDIGLLSKMFCEESDNLWCAVHVEDTSGSFGSWRRQAKVAKPDDYVLSLETVRNRMKKLGTTRPIINPSLSEGGSKKDLYYLAEGALKEEMARRRTRGDKPFSENDAMQYLVGEAKKGFPNNPQHQLKSVEQMIGNCDIDGDGMCSVKELGLSRQFYSEISAWEDFEIGPDSSLYNIRKAYFAWMVSSVQSPQTDVESLQRLVKGLNLGYEAQRSMAALVKNKKGRPVTGVDSGADKALKQATKLVVMNSLWALLVEGENETESASNGDPLPCVSTMLQCPSNECGLFDCFGVLFYLVIFVAGLYMIFIYRSGICSPLKLHL
jgi:hypothetical protein